MSKQEKIEGGLSPSLKSRYIVSVEAKEFNEVKFYKDFVGFYFNETNKKCLIEFTGSKGYFHSLTFSCEGQETVFSDEQKKYGFTNRLECEILEDKNFKKHGLVDFYDTPKGIFFKLKVNK
jgi:hypothetical protein